MLRLLQVENLALFARARVELGPGFQVFTGETGAGKSLIVDALNLLAGERGGAELVREGSDLLRVTGSFDALESTRVRLRELGFDEEAGELLVRRELSREGRSRAFLDDSPTTLRTLQGLVSSWLRIQGQRQELGLLEPEVQRELLDRVGGAAGEELRKRVAEAYAAWRRLAAEERRWREGFLGRRERIAELREALGSIDEVAPEPGEAGRLREECERLRHREGIAHAVAAALVALAEGDSAASDRLLLAERRLLEAGPWDRRCEEFARELREVRLRVADLARALGRIAGDLDPEPGRLDWVEARLARLERLAKRFGVDPDSLPAERERLAQELSELEEGEPAGSKLVSERDAAARSFRDQAVELSRERRDWARALEARVSRELADLGLGRAGLEVRVFSREDPSSELEVDGRAVACGPWGVDEVEYYWQPNPGEGVLPLARSASGGELSRISLALLVAAGGEVTAPNLTLVFDEIDSGLGGAQGAALGRKLRLLGQRYQVLAVTHLPQVASFAQRHFLVSKAVLRSRTEATVSVLEGSARRQEIARMLAADAVTPLALEHAAEMLEEGSEAS